MEKQSILFTGGTSGLGEVAFSKMANEGHHMILLARNLEAARQQFLELSKSAQIDYIYGDLSSFESLRIACKEIKEKYSSLDQLVLNAGLWNFRFKESKDGIEEILQVNLLSNILLIEELSSMLNNKSRIIITSSALHQGKVNFDDLEFRSNHSGYKAYRQSKLGVILLSKYLAVTLKKDAIKVVTQHPGVVNTRLGRDAGFMSNVIFKLIGKSSKKGAKTLLHLMTLDFDELQTGAYYASSKVKKTHSYSQDLKVAEKLWKYCLKTYLK